MARASERSSVRSASALPSHTSVVPSRPPTVIVVVADEEVMVGYVSVCTEGISKPTRDADSYVDIPTPIRVKKEAPRRSLSEGLGDPPTTILAGKAVSKDPLRHYFPKKKPRLPGLFNGSGGRISNLRPSGYEPDELPDCSTPRRMSVGV